MSTGAPLVLLLEMVISLACLSWITASILRAGKRMAAVQRRRRQLNRGRKELAQTSEVLRRDIYRQEIELRQTEEAISVRQAEAADLQSRLNDLRRQGPREYTLLNERFGDRDQLWLLTIPKPERPERWAVAASDSGTAMALLSGHVAAVERPVLDGQLN
ncbi:hypothetical protein VY88_07840 [Azospirillum thiophilum]|uniref:Uncharacterized protein n=1 Tax=Azospirillum thiophilum TaxID=528244 RepID=A0AAC8VVW7_9PROT|nr:hypothetical protein [Azospirillum thiophilum]ALG70350.1 hypothetical protein AL072_04870 [Azospirillum thiophilum]KJR65972.1 hypothetical protein VY88_07840 [Azospirillum thiophilum]